MDPKKLITEMLGQARTEPTPVSAKVTLPAGDRLLLHEQVAFAVLPLTRPGEDKQLFVPAKIVFDKKGTAVAVYLHEPSPYMALAYDYLMGDLSRHYSNLSLELAKRGK